MAERNCGIIRSIKSGHRRAIELKDQKSAMGLIAKHGELVIPEPNTILGMFKDVNWPGNYLFNPAQPPVYAPPCFVNRTDADDGMLALVESGFLAWMVLSGKKLPAFVIEEETFFDILIEEGYTPIGE